MALDPRTPDQYREALGRVFARLRASGGLSVFRLQQDESAKFTILNDPPAADGPDGWIEFPVHRLKAEKTRTLCSEFLGEDQCPWCATGIPQQRRIAIAIYNETISQVQIAHWAHYQDSPLVFLEDTYNATGQPFRGMQFSIRRRGTGLTTRYPMEYRGHLDSLAAIGDPKIPTREQIMGLLVATMQKTEDA